MIDKINGNTMNKTEVEKMTDVNKRIDDLIEIAKAATPGPWVYDSGNRTVETTDKSPAHRKAICSTDDLFDSSQEDEIRPYGETWDDSEYIATFNPDLVLKLLKSWKEMRIALEYINQDEWPGEALPVENDDGEINYSNLIDYYGKLTSEVLDKADKVFE